MFIETVVSTTRAPAERNGRGTVPSQYRSARARMSILPTRSTNIPSLRDGEPETHRSHPH